MKINLVKNTATGYMSMVIKMLQGIIVTRWLLESLGKEYYGLWSMLWAFFCYSLLLDFGFGVTAQKYTSAGLYKSNSGKYNSIISTVFCFHVCMSGLIIIATLIASFFVVPLFNLWNAPLEIVQICRKSLLIFGIGSALIFPTGIFPEILIGLQKIYLRNYFEMSSKIIELIGIVIIFSYDSGIITLIYFTLTLNALVNISMFFCIQRLIPSIKLRLRIDGATFREIFHFSGFVYMSSIFNMLWGRGTTLLISMLCGLSDLAMAQLGGRIPDLMIRIVSPYQENISPVTGLYYAQGKHRALGRILINSMRWNSFLSTGMTIGILLFAPDLLKLLFNYENEIATQICRWMALSFYVTQVFRSIPEKFMIMAERHRMLSWIRIGETSVYLILSFFLLQHFSVTSIVILALVLKLLSLIFFIAPLMLRYLHIGFLRLSYIIAIKPLCATLPMIAVTLLLWHFSGTSTSKIFVMFLSGIIGALAYVFIFAFLILSRNERALILKNIRKNLRTTLTRMRILQ